MEIKNRILTFFRKSKTFIVDGIEYEYYSHGYNSTRHNERCVEIPFVVDFLSDYNGKDILEVGNGLSNYFDVSEFSKHYRVVDKYEKSAGVVNKDILDIPALIKYDCIVSISTIEHVGNYGLDDDPKRAVRAIKHIKSLLKPGGAFVCIIPVGFHESLHDDFVDLFSDVFCLKRVNFYNEWVECEFDEVKDVKYSDPYNGAGAVLFGGVF